MNQKRKLIKFDWAIKRLLRSKANFRILEGFLSELYCKRVKRGGRHVKYYEVA